MTRRYDDKIALVTGGGSGLGEAFCKRLASEGAKVAVLDIDEAGGSRVAAEIRDAGGEAQFMSADVSDAPSMETAVASVVSRYGGLDVAVNNAGVGGGYAPVTEMPVDLWLQTIQINLTGVFFSMRAEIPAMLERGGGAIVNISSMVAQIAHANSTAYTASKHGVVGLTKSASLEWAPHKIRINAVGPTFVHTPMMDAFFTDEDYAHWDALHPIGRCAYPEDIAALVAFLASSEAAMITGALYLADGGYSVK